MEAQQIRLSINQLAAGIQEEAVLNACLEAMKGIEKAYRNLYKQTNGALAGKKSPAKNGTAEEILTPIDPGKTGPAASTEAEPTQPHDLSLVLLANEVFKGSEPAPPEVAVAFRRALLKTASKQPIL